MRKDPAQTRRVLPHRASRRVRSQGEVDQVLRRGIGEHLHPQCVSGDEGHMGNPSQPHRPHELSGLFPLPRRRPRGQGRQMPSPRTARPATTCSPWMRRSPRCSRTSASRRPAARRNQGTEGLGTSPVFSQGDRQGARFWIARQHFMGETFRNDVGRLLGALVKSVRPGRPSVPQSQSLSRCLSRYNRANKTTHVCLIPKSGRCASGSRSR